MTVFQMFETLMARMDNVEAALGIPPARLPQANQFQPQQQGVGLYSPHIVQGPPIPQQNVPQPQQYYPQQGMSHPQPAPRPDTVQPGENMEDYKQRMLNEGFMQAPLPPVTQTTERVGHPGVQQHVHQQIQPYIPQHMQPQPPVTSRCGVCGALAQWANSTQLNDGTTQGICAGCLSMTAGQRIQLYEQRMAVMQNQQPR